MKASDLGYNMPPEVYRKEKAIGWQIDLFSAGVILFIMKKGSEPFLKAKGDDKFWKLIEQKKEMIFWKY